MAEKDKFVLNGRLLVNLSKTVVTSVVMGAMFCIPFFALTRSVHTYMTIVPIAAVTSYFLFIKSDNVSFSDSLKNGAASYDAAYAWVKDMFTKLIGRSK